MTMTNKELEDLEFVDRNEALFQKAKRLRYRYGNQKPFTEPEMDKVLRLLEIMWERKMKNDPV